MIKRIILSFAAIMLMSVAAFSQGRSISKRPKLTTPYVTESGDTLRVGTTIQLLDGVGTNNCFKYVQAINKFNEPIQPATSKCSLKKQAILFFKEEDEVYYAFTDFFCINIEMALLKDEIRIIKAK